METHGTGSTRSEYSAGCGYIADFRGWHIPAPKGPLPLYVLLYIYFFFHTFTFQLLEKPWSLNVVLSLLAPGSRLEVLSRTGFSSPTAPRFVIECCQLKLLRFPQVKMCARNGPYEFIRACTREGFNSRN